MNGTFTFVAFGWVSFHAPKSAGRRVSRTVTRSPESSRAFSSSAVTTSAETPRSGNSSGSITKY